jgi:antitoxin CcdA
MMNATFDLSAPKRPANLSVNSDLLKKAKELEINLSATFEAALSATVREKLRAQWLEENREAIQAYNADVEEHGVFSDGLRSF